MTHLRKENVAVVYRKLAKDHWVQTLDGSKARSVNWCNSCREYKPLSHFYLKPERDRKHDNDVRDYCIDCFDKQNNLARKKREDKKAERKLNEMFIMNLMNGD